MKVTEIPILNGALGTVTKGLVPGLEHLEIRGRVKTLQDWKTYKSKDKWRPFKLQHYKDRPEYWEESWRLEETCCHSNSSEKPSANADVKNSEGVK